MLGRLDADSTFTVLCDFVVLPASGLVGTWIGRVPSVKRAVRSRIRVGLYFKAQGSGIETSGVQVFQGLVPAKLTET